MRAPQARQYSNASTVPSRFVRMNSPGTCQLSGTNDFAARCTTTVAGGNRLHVAGSATSPQPRPASMISWPSARSRGTRCLAMKPAAPVTRTLLIQETLFHLGEFVDRLAVVVGPADVEPIAVEATHVHGLPCLE